MARVPVLVRKVEKWLAEYETGAGGMIVAVSGGPDSVALLHALLATRGSPPDRPLQVVHLNHQLRGLESEADADFVRDLHTRLAAQEPALGWLSAAIDVAAQARTEGANLESVARRARYAWLVEAAEATGSRWVATGHTANDQAETVLHRLLRGSGLQGLRGIAPRRTLAPGIDLIRPLLNVTRAEVLDFLEEHDQLYRLDQTNRDLAFTRNRLRHELLPLLVRQYNPAIVGVLCRLARQAQDVHWRERAEGQNLLAEAELPRAGKLVILDRRRLAGLSHRLVREALRLVWQRENWPTGRMSFAAWDRAAAVALGAASSADLPGKIHIRCREAVVQLGPAE
jgi:tRNA(Ile)-lysidine synthase